MYNTTQISIRFRWLSKVVAPVDTTLPLFYGFIFCSHCSRSEYAVSTVYSDHRRELYRVPYEQLSVIYTGKKLYAIFLNGENEAAL